MISPDGQQGLGRQQVEGAGLEVWLGHFYLGDHQLDLLPAHPAQVPAGGGQQAGGEPETSHSHIWSHWQSQCDTTLTCLLHVRSLRPPSMVTRSELRSLLD